MIVRAGNGRLIAAKSLGWEYIAAIVTDSDKIESLELAIIDNKSAELSSWNIHNLSNAFKEIEEIKPDSIFDLGFTDTEIKNIKTITDERKDDQISNKRDIEAYNILIELDDESKQIDLLEEFKKRGIKCRSLIY